LAFVVFQFKNKDTSGKQMSFLKGNCVSCIWMLIEIKNTKN
jgi:hypothetical protein